MQISRKNTTNLNEESIALIFQLRAMVYNRIVRNEIGKLDDQKIAKIKIKIKDMLAL